VIVWKDGTSGKGVVQLVGKIVPKEWRTYCRRLIKANATDIVRIQTRLKETKQKIRENGGFQ